METKTFKEVHAEIENEHLFLQKNHDIKNFKAKADFLQQIGFINSIATKLYSAVAENHTIVNEYARKYNGQYKFILKPQLERVCEKYNLFVRDLKFFLGDIPEKNIKDMIGFSIFFEDIIIADRYKADYLKRYGHLMKIENKFLSNEKHIKIPIQHFGEMGLSDCIQIASVRSLFSEAAFAESQARILDRTELAAKNQVELDPIVLFETKHGYLIITAWGDEANDELIVNQNHN